MVRSVDYSECKGPYRHAWFDHDGSGFRAPPFGVAMHLECIRCTTVRRDILSRVDGSLLQRRYYYPEGYKDAASEKPSTNELRLMGLKTQRKHLKESKGLPSVSRRVK